MPALTAPALVAYYQGSGVRNIPVTLSDAIAIGDRIVIVLGGSVGMAAGGPSDPGSNVYTVRPALAGGWIRVADAICKTALASGTVITVNRQAGTAAGWIWIFAIRNNPSPFLDQKGIDPGVGPNVSGTPANIKAGGVAFGCLRVSDAGAATVTMTPTAGVGWTTTGSPTAVAAENYLCYYALNSASGTLGLAGTLSKAVTGSTIITVAYMPLGTPNSVLI